MTRPAFWLVFTCHARRDYLLNPQYRRSIFKILKEQAEKLNFRLNSIIFTSNKLMLIITPFNARYLDRIIFRIQVKSGRYVRDFLELPTSLWEGRPLVKTLVTEEELAEKKQYLKSLKSLDLF